jgi:vancomycin permeability regulator SanA
LISQQFQVERGLIACRYFDMNCHGITTENISFTIAPKIYVREYGARIKLWYDILNPQPSLGGKKEKTPWNTNL